MKFVVWKKCTEVSTFKKKRRHSFPVIDIDISPLYDDGKWPNSLWSRFGQVTNAQNRPANPAISKKVTIQQIQKPIQFLSHLFAGLPPWFTAYDDSIKWNSHVLSVVSLKPLTIVLGPCPKNNEKNGRISILNFVNPYFMVTKIKFGNLLNHEMVSMLYTVYTVDNTHNCYLLRFCVKVSKKYG